jgi:hypothetical protein
MERTCVVCGIDFTHKTRATCSKRCRYTLVSAKHRAAGIKPPGHVTEEHRRAASERFSGPNHPRWNGGKTSTSRGYVLVKPPEGFPFPEMINRRGYVREHRLVLALHLGRALERREVTHHRNGDRSDNRLENLELHGSHSEHMRQHHGR